MLDLKLGTYPPMFPRAVFLEKQLRSLLTGMVIMKTSWERYYTGDYSWYGDVIPGFNELSGHKIVFADASCILTDKGALVYYAYSDGGLRYFREGETITYPKAVKSASHGYYAKLFLTDGSCLAVNQYGWGTLFKVFQVDLGAADVWFNGKNGRYPFLPSGPIDISDEEDFTYERFRNWLGEYPNANIIETCATAKGALRIENPVMNYILLISKVHPRTKTRALTESEMRAVYDNTLNLVRAYKSGARICGHTDIFGNVVPPDNDILWMTASTLGTPCPVCGSPIASTPAAGTKMYFCPGCQIIKK